MPAQVCDRDRCRSCACQHRSPRCLRQTGPASRCRRSSSAAWRSRPAADRFEGGAGTLWLVFSGALANSGADIRPVETGAWAYSRTLANEFPHLDVRRVDIAPGVAGRGGRGAAARHHRVGNRGDRAPDRRSRHLRRARRWARRDARAVAAAACRSGQAAAAHRGRSPSRLGAGRAPRPRPRARWRSRSRRPDSISATSCG